ncbi:MAG: exopolysaccharide biosynthesis protein, partial [Paracoccaceae bacterium]
RTMSRLLHGALLRHKLAGRVAVGEILTSLGDRSFGWAILFFALINMIPAPYGSTLVTAPPLMLLTAQMALGRRHVHLPGLVARRRIPVDGMRRLLVRLRGLLRPIERVVRPRRLGMFLPRNERLIGAALFAVACALLLPLPLSGGIPAFALLVSALALIERDGVLMTVALGIGALSIGVTAGMVTLIAAGIETLF